MSRVELVGGKEFSAALAKLGGIIPQACDDVVMETAAEIEADIKLRIQSGAKTGRIYVTEYDGTYGRVKIQGTDEVVAVFKSNAVASTTPAHQASAPGEAYASDTGGHIGSINHERDGFAKASVVSRLKTSVYLEFGTRRMSPRPAWVPALQAAEPEFQKALMKAIGDAIK